MDSDTSDILGGPTFPNARDSQSGWWSSLPFGAKLVFALMVSSIFYVVFVRMREIFLVWREKAYKLAMRRRHGIPDNDHRPFNVAYAAVLRSRQEGEEKARRARLHESIPDQQSAPPDQDSRQRIPRGASTKLNLPGRYESADIASSAYGRASGSSHLRPSFVSNLDAQDYHNPNSAVRIADPEIIDIPPKLSPSRRAAKDTSQKHGHNGGHESDYSRKVRVEDEELRGDEEYEWIEENGSPRGWKRGHGDNFDDEVDDSLHIRDKRQRKVSLDKSFQLVGEDMDIDEDEDEISALPSFARGKKRDRAEAGSTFGGDDEDDSDRGINLEQARHRHRKRRTYAKRKSDAGVSSRGTKRDRELAEGDSEIENEENMSPQTSRKKRGKKATRAPQPDDRSDVSMDESLASSSRSRPKRSIGDEWESNGVKYKIGSNGQRLRQTLIRKERQKFPMPEDSQHPDRQANFEVYVETWLTEEEYREAKDQQLLAWQDSNKASAEPQTPTIESPEEVPLVAGKDLLWNSTSNHMGGTSTPRQITPPTTPQAKQRNNDSIGSSTASSVGLRINPFVNPPPAGKRISTVRRPSSLKLDAVSTVPSTPAGSVVHSLSDSTNNSPRHKAFSKWEKQDLEAKAMMKIRQANRLKEEERLEKLKKEQEAAAAAPSKPIPTITVTKADDAKPVETKQSAFSFATPPVANSTKKDVPNPLFSAGSAKETIQPSLFAPTTSQPTTKLPPIPTPVTTSGTQPAKTTGGLFGSKPEQLNSFVSFGPSSSASSSTVPATSVPASASANPGIPTSKSAFSFGPTPSPAQPTQATQGSEKNESAAGGSLLSRLAPPSTPMPAVQATQPSQATSPFGTSKSPTLEPPKTASAFGNSNTAQSSSLSQPSTASTGPKFDFGIGKSPASLTTTTTPSAATSGSSAIKPASSFTFNTSSNTAEKNNTATSSTNPASTATESPTTAPKFSFSIPSSSSPNPFAPKTNGPLTSTATTTAPAQSAFSFGSKPVGTGTSNPVPSSFGAFGAQTAPAASVTTSTAPAQSSFGSFGTKSNGASTTIPAQSAFGTQQASVTAPAQSVFSFGTKQNDNTSTPSAFGTQPTAAASAPAQSTFAMGTSSATGSISSTFGVSNAFGSKPNADSSSAPVSAQSAFGGGSNNSSSTASPFGAGFSFGKPTTDTSAATPAASKDNASKPVFSFGKPVVASSSATPSMTPSSTPAPTSTGVPSAFGSSSSSAFTFGSAAKNPSSAPTDSPFGKPADTSAFGFGSGNAFSGFGKAPASTGQQQQ
ncbi:hypothetical protein C0993_001333 [Termitomyces sp. T159_Od127]|nr:hypothetical protein C0993_001333 [Termitomyces sp. T159_Od127]